MDAAKIRAELAKPFADEVLQKVSKGGANLTYVPVAEVIARLNLVLGTENWGEEYARVQILPQFPESIVAEVKIWVIIDGQKTEKIGFGGEAIKFYKKGGANEGKPLDLGDSFKGAKSDAFKKACTELGVGLDIARKEDALYVEEEERERLTNDGKPLLTDDDVALIKGRIGELSPDQRKAFGEWWIENIPYGLNTGKVTEAYLPRIATQLDTYEIAD